MHHRHGSVQPTETDPRRSQHLAALLRQTGYAHRLFASAESHHADPPLPVLLLRCPHEPVPGGANTSTAQADCCRWWPAARAETSLMRVGDAGICIPQGAGNKAALVSRFACR
jgi:hypothetical protein